jgi:hypothetical protein
VQPFRERKHFEAAEESWRLENLRRSVPSGKSAPTNPFIPERKNIGGDFHTGRGSKALVKDDKAPQPISHERPGPASLAGGSKRRRRPLWK